MIPRDILCLDTGDLDLTMGLRLTSDLKTYTRQRLRQRLRFFLGEWFLDQRLGIPYFERVFVANPDLPLMTSIMRKAILKTTGVGGVESLSLDFDRKTRTLLVSFVARLIGNTDTIVFSSEPFVLDLREAA